ncbi:MAG: phycobilisome rod-core linker polypeptide, partial [Cyanobium sp.]
MSMNQSPALGFGATQLLDAPASFSRRPNHQATEAATSNDRFRNQQDLNDPGAFTANDNATYQLAVNAAYRQVFGNVQPMESERLLSAESQLRNGDISVRGFVRRLALSSFYRSRYFDAVSPHRAVELNFKHLLGRPPQDEAEISAHVLTVANSGFEGEINSYLDSDEYLQTFGEDTVPYPTSWNSPLGQPQSAFNRMAALEQNFAGSDTAVGNKSQLLGNLARGYRLSIKVPAQVYRSGNAGSVNRSMAGGTRGMFEPVRRINADGGDSAPMRGDLYVGFGLGQRDQEVFERSGGESADQIAGLIRAAYRQVMGNPHLMESERSLTAESQFAEGRLNTREFVRAVALSPDYRRRFFESNAPYRFVELNFKHLLGRAPLTQAEVSEHIQRLANDGYEAEINSYIDSDEYQNLFGENTIPFARISSEQGRSQLAFNRHLSLAGGYASSDTVQSASNLVMSVATNTVPINWSNTTQRINRIGANAGTTEPTGKRYRIVVQAQPAGGRQRTPNATYLVSGKDMTSQLGYVHRRGGRILSITEVL